TADQPCCRAGRLTAPAWCSRHAQRLLPSAVCAVSITTMPLPAGASTRRARRPMSTLSRLGLMAVPFALMPSLTQAQQFGQPISPAEVAPWDISIGPDGATLPPGHGTASQGEAVYVAKCAACHGEKGAGGPVDVLAGGMGSLATGKTPVKTVGSYWPYA